MELEELNDPVEIMQFLLDCLGTKPGSIIYRDVDIWRVLEPGNFGDVLALSEDLLPIWVNPDA